MLAHNAYSKACRVGCENEISDENHIVDFYTRTMKVNAGEASKYYAEA